MTAARFLMCPPEYYEVAYEINPWMCVRHRVDKKRAVRQWVACYDLLTQKLGAKICLMNPVPGLPDLVFTANGGLVHKRIFLRSNFRYKERKGEEYYFESWFRKKGYRVKILEKPFCFEGEGDALFMGKELYSGFHFRSELMAHDRVSGHLKSSYFALQLRDKRFYHLDTCFMPLGEKTALVFFHAFESYSQLILWDSIPDPIPVPRDEALKFACNSIAVGKNVIVPKGCPQTTRELGKRGFRVHPLDFSEFIKAGGAAKCLVLRLN